MNKKSLYKFNMNHVLILHCCVMITLFVTNYAHAEKKNTDMATKRSVQSESMYKKGEYIVSLSKGIDPGLIEDTLGHLGILKKRPLGLDKYLVILSEPYNISQIENLNRQYRGQMLIEPNYIYTIDNKNKKLNRELKK